MCRESVQKVYQKSTKDVLSVQIDKKCVTSPVAFNFDYVKGDVVE